MLETISGLGFEVERGPELLFVRAIQQPDTDWSDLPLADGVWSILEQNFTYSVVLELDQVELLRSYLIGQLIVLAKRIQQHDGLLRICGLSAINRRALELCRLNAILPNYRDRSEAIMCSRPAPR